MKKNVKAPSDIETPISTYGMSEEEIAELVQIGLDSAKEGTYTAEEIREMMRKNIDIREPKKEELYSSFLVIVLFE